MTNSWSHKLNTFQMAIEQFNSTRLGSTQRFFFYYSHVAALLRIFFHNFFLLRSHQYCVIEAIYLLSVLRSSFTVHLSLTSHIVQTFEIWWKLKHFVTKVLDTSFSLIKWIFFVFGCRSGWWICDHVFLMVFYLSSNRRSIDWNEQKNLISKNKPKSSGSCSCSCQTIHRPSILCEKNIISPDRNL